MSRSMRGTAPASWWSASGRAASAKTRSFDAWPKDVAHSTALRRWFGHDPARWQEFCQRYTAELDARPDAWRLILQAAGSGTVTLLYSAHDMEHNNAVALKAYLEALPREPLSTGESPQ